MPSDPSHQVPSDFMHQQSAWTLESYNPSGQHFDKIVKGIVACIHPELAIPFLSISPRNSADSNCSVCATRSYIRIVEYEYFYFRLGEGDMTLPFYDDSDNRAEVTTTKQLLSLTPTGKCHHLDATPEYFWMK